jgi:hypothetical protein
MASATLSLGLKVRKGVRMICPWPLAIHDAYSWAAPPTVFDSRAGVRHFYPAPGDLPQSHPNPPREFATGVPVL